MSNVFCFLFHVYPSTYIAWGRATLYRKQLRIMWKRGRIFWCTAFKSVKVPLYKEHGGSQKKTGGLCCFRRAKSSDRVSCGTEGERKESKCVMGKLPHDLVAHHAVMDRGWELVWKDSCCTLLVPALLVCAEGCCFPNLCWFFGPLCALFCKMLVPAPWQILHCLYLSVG